MKVPLVLVVDDDIGTTRFLVTLLEDHGYEVAGACSGAEADARIAERVPDLLLLDLHLGDMDAATFLRRARRRGYDLPFVCISGQGDERTAVEMMKLGALEYLLKDTELWQRIPVVVEEGLAQIEVTRNRVVSEKERRRLEAELIEVCERERRSIGHDLHDGLGQRLSAMALVAYALSEQLKTKDPGLGATARQLFDIAKGLSNDLRDAIGETRRLARRLSPVSLETDGLTSALQALADNVNGDGVLNVFVVATERVHFFDPSAANHLYEIAREALNNAVNHSHGSRVSLSLRRRGADLELTITDDGIGIYPTPAIQPGMGMRVMDFRARLIGAKLEVLESPHGGTTVICTLPLPP